MHAASRGITRTQAAVQPLLKTWMLFSRPALIYCLGKANPRFGDFFFLFKFLSASIATVNQFYNIESQSSNRFYYDSGQALAFSSDSF